MKLVYYCYAWYLHRTGKALFADKIECYDKGPVIKNIYDDIKPFFNIHEPIRSGFRFKTAFWDYIYIEYVMYTEYPDVTKDENISFVLKGVCGYFAMHDAKYLLELEYKPGVPWSKNYDKYKNKVLNKDKTLRELIKKEAEPQIKEYVKEFDEYLIIDTKNTYWC